EGSFSELLDQPSTEPPKFGVVVGQVEDGDQGLLIRKILPRSIAAKNGLQPGDIILQVGDDVILSVKDLKTSITKQTSGTKVPVLVTRRSLDLEIEVGF
ncbi:MAG: PDZ domain-containing protein, partial [Planctomicrobium sp.]|nr:PDZ domain-containing protein [Planctomicrobium sp.]